MGKEGMASAARKVFGSLAPYLVIVVGTALSIRFSLPEAYWAPSVAVISLILSERLKGERAVREARSAAALEDERRRIRLQLERAAVVYEAAAGCYATLRTHVLGKDLRQAVRDAIHKIEVYGVSVPVEWLREARAVADAVLGVSTGARTKEEAEEDAKRHLDALRGLAAEFFDPASLAARDSRSIQLLAALTREFSPSVRFDLSPLGSLVAGLFFRESEPVDEEHGEEVGVIPAVLAEGSVVSSPDAEQGNGDGGSGTPS